jgi:GNAT superfamily N-acetyltransferase
MVDIRPMRAGDEVDAEAAWDHAYRTLLVEQHLPTFDRTPALIDHTRLRMAYLRHSDPGGSWVAESNGSIVGIAQAHVRGDRWVLATLGVVPEHQERGAGRALLDRALDYGKAAGVGAIFSSPDPRAVHRYASAGFDLHPTVVALGPARRLPGAPSGVGDGTAGDIAVVNAIDHAVRGGTRAADIEFQLGAGLRLLLDGGRGYALVRGGRVLTLAATDEESAVRLLQAAIARSADGEQISVSWITARQQWAVRVLVSAGVPLFVHEAVMTRGHWEPELPYLASGIFG